MKFFVYDNVNGNVSLEDPSIILVKEFESLMGDNRNSGTSDKTGKKKHRAFKEFKYIYLFFDWESPYFQYSEQDRHKEALKDSGLSAEEFDDPAFREACIKYNEIQDSSQDIKILKSAMSAVDKVAYYLENVDMQERDSATGKPIFKTKDIIAEIKGCKDLISTLRELKIQVQKGLEIESNVRGNMEIGLFD
jgi:hypothetical protein